MKKFGIDRGTLKNNGLDEVDINRIYRALYVYSLGFYELVREPIERGKNRKLILATIWKIYSVLLQYVGKTEYSTIVTELTNAYQIDVQKLEERMEKNRSEYIKMKENMVLRISTLEDRLKKTTNCKILVSLSKSIYLNFCYFTINEDLKYYILKYFS